MEAPILREASFTSKVQRKQRAVRSRGAQAENESFF